MLTRTPPIPCQEMVEIITDYLEGALPRRERRRFDVHISGCPHCREYLAQMRTTIALTGRLREHDLTPVMRVEFAEVFERWRAEVDDRA